MSTSKPEPPTPDLEPALNALRRGDTAAAHALLSGILETQPDNAEAGYFLGLCLHRAGRHGEAAERIAAALPALGHPPEARFNLGLIESAAGDQARAAETFRQLLADGHDTPDLRNAFALALKLDGRAAAAGTAFDNLVAAHPAYAPGHFNRGNFLFASGRVQEAADAFAEAHRLTPTDDAVRRNLAAALQALGRLDDAEALLRQVLDGHPNDGPALNNLGNVLRQRGALDDALETLKHARLAAPESADAAYNLGTVLGDLNDTAAAIDEFRTAANLRPGFVKADWATELTLPQIYGSEDARSEYRARWLAAVRGIDAADIPIDAALAAISEITPFALAYQGADDTEGMTRWGNLVADIAARAFPDMTDRPAHDSNRARIKVGFVSAHFRAHTVSRLFSGWITGLDPDAFEVHLISTSGPGGPGDAETQRLAGAAWAAHLKPMGVGELARHIRDLGLDIVIYPDIGMDPVTQVLAALPLGRRQMMGWGHPVTSGLPTMDVFLSAAAMEPDSAEAHYRERLHRLPGLSISYPRPPVPSGTGPVTDFLCAQSLFKIAPSQDRVFADIAKAAGGARIGFIGHPIAAVTDAFERRIGAAFRAAGLDPAMHIVMLPPTGRDGFLGYLAGARVVLDTFQWSGGNTSLEALALGRPVVTLPGPLMRGRHTKAMLDILACPDLIAGSDDDYTAKAVDLVTDAAAWRAAHARIAAGAGHLFDDPAPVLALNDFLKADAPRQP